MNLKKLNIKVLAMPALQWPFAQAGSACNGVSVKPLRFGVRGNMAAFLNINLSKFQEIVDT